MTVKKCSSCNKRSGLLEEMLVPDRPHYHGKFYHAHCFLSMQGAVHRDGDPNDTCSDNSCNAALFMPARWYSGVGLATTGACQLLSYLHLAVLMYYGMLGVIFLDPVLFNFLYGALGVLCIVAYRRNSGKMLAFALSYAYARYYCSWDLAAASMYDVFLIAKLTLFLWLFERGARVCLLLRVVHPVQWARESGTLLWTCHAWPAHDAMPMYVSLIGGAAICGVVYNVYGVLLAPPFWVAAVGAVSFAVLAYPPRVVPRWRAHAEELLSLPF